MTSTQIGPNAIGSSELADASVDTAAVIDGAITNVKLASGIDGNKLISGSVNTLQLADNSVTTAKILNGAVGDEKISGLGWQQDFCKHSKQHTSLLVIQSKQSTLLTLLSPTTSLLGALTAGSLLKIQLVTPSYQAIQSTRLTSSTQQSLMTSSLLALMAAN